jgi:hypothetical protein
MKSQTMISDDSDSARLITKRNLEPKPTEPAQKAGAASFAIRIQYRGEERTTELPLTQDMIGQLAFEAAFRNVSIGEFIGELIVAVVKQDLLQAALKCKEAENKQL